MTNKLYTLNKTRNTIHGLVLSQNNDISNVEIDPNQTLTFSIKEEISNNSSFGLGDVTHMFVDSMETENGNILAANGLKVSFTFSTDGTKLYICVIDYESNDDTIVRQYNLQEPFVACVSDDYFDSPDLTTLDTMRAYAYDSMTFNDTGDKLFFGVNNSSNIAEYSLSTPWDITTVSFVDHISTSSIGRIQGFRFGNSGNKLYLHGNYDEVHQCSLSTPYDVSTFTEDAVMYNFDTDLGDLGSFDINDDGTQLLAIKNDEFNSRGILYLYNFGTPFDLSTITLVGSKGTDSLTIAESTGFASQPPDDLRFNSNGDLITILASTEIINIVVNDNSVNSTYSKETKETSYQSFAFSDSGNKLYVIGEDTKRIYEFNVSPAYEISNAVLNQSYQYNTNYNLSDLVFNDAGTIMFALDNDSTRIRRYTLSTAWDISTLSHTNSYSIAGQVSSAGSMSVNNTGSRVYVTNINNNRMYEYQMDPVWDLGGISYTGNFYDLGNEDPIVRGIDFSDDGTKLYMLGNNTKSVYQYNSSVNASGGYSTDISAFGMSSIPTIAFLTGDLPIFETSFGPTGRSLINDLELDFTSATSTQMTSPFSNGRIPEVGDEFVFYTINAQVSGENSQITDVVDEGGGTYTVTYNAISAAPDKQYGLPVMKARRLRHSASDYALSSGTDVTMFFDPVEAQGRELAFRHISKLPDDRIKLTRYDLKRLQS